MVVARDPSIEKNGTFWLCKCDCGKEISVRQDRLKNGNTKSCGCLNINNIHQKRRNSDDLTGKTFGNLTVIKYIDSDDHNNTRWLCKCNLCGASPILRAADIKKQRSCGCLAKKSAKKNCEELRQVISETKTNPGRLKQESINKNNKTGTKGVCYLKKQGRYVAYITFQGKRYSLKRSKDIEVCISARKEAEKELFGNFLEWYERNYKNNPPQK